MSTASVLLVRQYYTHVQITIVPAIFYIQINLILCAFNIISTIVVYFKFLSART
jgi:hypothetical protein